MRLGILKGTSYAILLKFRLRTLRVFQAYSMLSALKSLMLFFYALRVTRLGRADTW